MTKGKSTVLNAFTIDVEDWFHILDLRPSPPLKDWPQYESRVERNTRRLLLLLERAGVKATCFILGWVIEQYPELAREIREAGHEIASHGYAHELIYEITPDRFETDIRKSIQLTEEACSVRPYGYRAPGFSITKSTKWALDILADAGFNYDSSFFPARRGHGGYRTSPRHAHAVELEAGRQLVEIPISVTSIAGRSVAYAGGGYLRLFPYPFIRRAFQKANAAGQPVVLYIHPRDIDPDQPRLKMPPHRAFKTYVGLSSAESKLRRLLAEFSFGAIEDVLEKQALGGPTGR